MEYRRPIVERGKKFCSSCGRQHGTISVPTTYRDGPHEIVGECLTEIPLDRKDGTFMLVPNRTKIYGDREPFFDESDEFHTDLRSFDWQSEVKWLQDIYKEPIAELQKTFPTYK